MQSFERRLRNFRTVWPDDEKSSTRSTNQCWRPQFCCVRIWTMSAPTSLLWFSAMSALPRCSATIQEYGMPA